MSLPRVLLVEDDASIRRFVALALEDDGVELVQAASLAQAAQALQGAPFTLVLCDLMLPDGSGLDLLRELGQATDARTARHAAARRVAFSAGVSAPMRRQLEQAGVHEVLHKPASLDELMACLARATAPGPAPAQPDAQADPQAAVQADAEADAQAVHTYFGGDQGLYDAYLAQCRPQFARDAEAGDRAQSQADLPALRRLAHSLKSVWRCLGFDADSGLAAQVEDRAAGQQADAAWAQWPALRARLLAHAQRGTESRA